MSIIQQIREKYAAVGIGFIALSLIGFILMDSAKNNSGGGVDPQDAIGEINGRSISYNEFITKVQSIEKMQEMNGRVVNEELRQQINGEVWRQLVERTLLEAEYSKLGIQVTDKEFNDILFGENPPAWLTQQFTGEDGKFDVVAAKQAISELKRNRNAGNVDVIEQFYLDPTMDQALGEKYRALQQNTVFVPKFLAEKTLADNSATASFKYVQIPYTSIADSTVKITDAMIEKYVAAHQRDFRQDENMRSIAYVSFPYNPSAQDSAAALNVLKALKSEFDTTPNPGEFVARNGSNIPFADNYFSRDRIQIPQKDSIIGAGLGKVYGPYLDGNAWVMSRVVDIKNRPDSVKARHILIGINDPASGQPMRTDSVAKALADSLLAVIKAGSSFDGLARTYSNDQGSAEKGGDLGYFSSGAMVPEFNDYCFSNSKGAMGIVKTQFGYHLIEVVDQKNFAQAYKIAYMAKTIDPSMETVNDALNKANLFAGNSRTLKAFDEQVIKSGYNKLVAPDIRENEFNIMGLGVNRGLVKDIFEAKVGAVLEPVEMQGQYLVIAVTSAEKSGSMSAAKARPMVEPVLRNEEKAKMIIKDKFTGRTTLEAVANANGVIVQQADSVTFVSPMINGVGFEPKVGGAAFAKKYQGKDSGPIPGNSGVFMIKGVAVGAVQNTGATVDDIRTSLLNQSRGTAISSSIQALKDKSKITDKRSKFL